MDVIVDFRQIGMFDFSPNEELFLKGFNYVALIPFEPLCPFCGKELKNSNCECKDFKVAHKRLCSSYPRNNVFTKAYEARSSFLSGIKNVDVKTREVSPHNVEYCLFDKGTVAHAVGSDEYWFISPGVFKGDELTFYIRKKESNKIFHCTISNLTYPPKEYSEVSFYYHYTATDVHHRGSLLVTKRDKIDTISYEDFLEKLKKAK